MIDESEFGFSLVFVDSLLISFSISENAQKIKIISEAYFKYNYKNDVVKGIVEIIIENIRKLELNINDEFGIDLDREYDKKQNHYKANEIYKFDVVKEENKKDNKNGKVKYLIILDSDFLKMNSVSENLIVRRVE